ncbi:ABC transporter ATP-binding protein [Brucella sp. NBRC 12950]|uniref:ABC transporter ATP-binding protein n=1 Tax=Brucella sp. NBRC 12950 TaxID=2994518 RepID=UPI0024A15C83|nr:ABC transporter ATP-binding protein [Brucella sp. NBRC 12950]GLU25461.1 Fe3+/spermidine/putrescine ABC transporter ATP-binding protein [Brucella sp. NBRC 12950]
MSHETEIHTDVAVEAEGLGLAYGSNTILKNIDLSLAKGQTLALLGPSGCGKTTLLRLIAGLLHPTRGSVTINGETVADAKSSRFSPPEKRRLGMVFQDYALWPHMSVYGNVSFPLEMRGVGRVERETRVTAALDRVGLAGFGDRSISEMSGGQQQRVAIARAIVAEPSIVLFDEPLSNLDRELRENMVSEIGQLVTNLGLTAIYVTHDQSEAFSLAHQVAIMRAGIIEQLAAPEMLVAQPTTPAVADFLRLGCVMPVERDDEGYRIAQTQIHLAHHSAPTMATHVLLPSRSVRSVEMSNGSIPATVLRTQFRGDGHLTTVRIGSQHEGHELTYLDSARHSPGVPLGIAIDAEQLRWFS